ncbi:MAG: enoyl-CoA hydratase [Actinomyces sp.]|nr:MAG: enoyl-CoA hydratase [Actinomyces sp.]
MDLKTTRWDVDDGVGVLTLSRPARHNAWTGRMHTEVRHLLALADDDPAVRAVVVTGDPDGGAFCPGADTRALEGHVERGGYDAGTPPDLVTPGEMFDPRIDADFSWFLGLRTVTIAAVNGAAAGVGMVLACWCDLRVAARGAKWTTAHGRLNLPAEYGLSWLLPRLIGLSRANDLLLSSRVALSEELADMGLVNRLADPDGVLDTARRWAHQLVAETSPHALAATKRQLAADLLHDDPARSVRDAQARLDAMTTEDDYREAIRAFLERRPARWRGRPDG